jgi:multidrug efflux system outer membrane protein
VVKRYEIEAVSAVEVSQARTTVETARADVVRFAGQVAQDINALDLLAGAQAERQLLPQVFDMAVSGLAPLPAGLPSEVLLWRPDILQAEHLLRSANANIGTARATFFSRRCP